MKWLRPDVPIILHTGLMEPPTDAEQADLILPKGLPMAEFLAVIARVIAKSQPEEGM